MLCYVMKGEEGRGEKIEKRKLRGMEERREERKRGREEERKRGCVLPWSYAHEER